MILKISILVIGIILKLIGEKWWHDAQRFILPTVYAIGVSIQSQCLWLGLTVLPMIAPIDLGYNDYGKNPNENRAVWLFVICVFGTIYPTIHGNISWFFTVPYLMASGWVGMLASKIDNTFGAPINGACIVLPIFFVHPLSVALLQAVHGNV